MSSETTPLIKSAGQPRQKPSSSLPWRIAGRIGGGAMVLWAAVSLSFIAVWLAPGDIVSLLVGEQVRTPEIEAAIRAEWGLDRPLWQQYLNYLWRIVHGDFGRSYMLNVDVGQLVFSQLLPTLKLAGAALLVSVVFAVLVAVSTAHRRWGRNFASGLELLLASTPSFWLGIVLLFVFSFTLRWFPVAGDRNFAALVLPSLSLGLAQGAVVSQVLRRGLEDALDQPFSLTLRAWGIHGVIVRLRHALRHAALPAVTLTGWLVGGLLSGAVITEQVFSRPGLGKVTVDAVLAKDMPVVLAVAILSALVYVVMSTLVDILGLLIDPRLRSQAEKE
ncbi:ABC transporter permease [Erwinia sp. JUb26]|uniref:ABC transporter permease n=1 Tax=Erwinia sp. JUb26 TaxID=2485126 RepID=UPI000F4749B0|nr:ABC transporter permease [Erwinia sp. JUb26]ROR10014.1 peptide/nickel transport system permease protein [Erwinia sp. JUb26]